MLFDLKRKDFSKDYEQDGDNQMFEITKFDRKDFSEDFEVEVKPTSRTRTLTGHATFTAADGKVHILDGGAASRNFNPSGDFDPYTEIIIINAGSTDNIVFDSTGANQTIGAGAYAHCFWDGTDWR